MLLASFIAHFVVYSYIVHHVSGILFFKGFPNQVSWTTAEANCRLCTVQLATWASQSEYDRIKRAQSNVHGGVAHVWVGLSDEEEEGKWRFIDGNNNYCGPGGDCDTLSQWAPYEPSGGAEDCAEIRDGLLNDVPSSDGNGYVCEFQCGGNNFYAAFSEIVDWNTAKARCASFGHGLATFHSQSEYDQVKTAREFTGAAAVWVGLTDKDAEGKWKFIDNNMGYCGVDCDNLNQWVQGQPNDSGCVGEDYAHLTSTGLNDVSNDATTQGYVCRFEGGGGYHGLSEY